VAEERLERAVRGTCDGPWEYEVASDAYWLTPYFMEMLGYEPGELPPPREVIPSLIHPNDVRTQQQAFKRHLAGEGPYGVEFRVRTKSGDYPWFRSRVSANVLLTARRGGCRVRSGMSRSAANTSKH
jgi:two-component system sensor histidine kinase UhpB